MNKSELRSTGPFQAIAIPLKDAMGNASIRGGVFGHFWALIEATWPPRMWVKQGDATERVWLRV